MEKQLKMKIILLQMLLFLFTSVAVFADNWELKKEKDGVKVYSRNIQGSDNKEVRATFFLKTSMNSLIALLCDVPGFKDWVYHCGEVAILSKISSNEKYYYQKTTVPWPVSDRDVIIHSQWKQDTVTKIIEIHGSGIPDYIAEKDGLVRIRKFSNSWKLTPLKNGVIQIDYQVNVDPGGSIPAWLANLTITEGPYQTCLSIANAIKNSKYQSITGLVLEP